MFEFITKTMYWRDLETPEVEARLAQTHRQLICMKHAQDAFILGRIGESTGKRIVEVGGGWGRVLRTLDPTNERWNLDKSAGPGRVGAEVGRSMPKEFRLVNALLGDFSQDLPDGYFDIVFSISVMEHIPASAIPAFWEDHARIMRPGGIAYHAIDFYLGDKPLSVNETRLDSYLEGIQKNGLQLIGVPNITRPAIFSASFASAPDLTMLHMNEISPALAAARHHRQNVSLAVGVCRPA